MRLKRDRIDDRPMQTSHPSYYDQSFQTKSLKAYDKSRLPPGKFLVYLFIYLCSRTVIKQPIDINVEVELYCIFTVLVQFIMYACHFT